MAENRCVQPNATWVRCCICKKAIKTCERKISVNNDYRCPEHPQGVQLDSGEWTCSQKCWDAAVCREENDDIGNRALQRTS